MISVTMPFGIPTSTIAMTTKQAHHVFAGSTTEIEELFGPPLISAEMTSCSTLMQAMDSTLQDTTRQITIPIDKNDWTPTDEQRFKQLVKKEALNTASPDEQRELESLLATRRIIHNPRTSDEIIHEYKQRLITKELIKAMTRYVEFSKPAH